MWDFRGEDEAGVTSYVDEGEPSKYPRPPPKTLAEGFTLVLNTTGARANRDGRSATSYPLT